MFNVSMVDCIMLMLSDCSELKQFFTTSRWNGLKNKNIRGCVVIMNMREELNILDKHINYIADYEAGSPFIDITTILNISHRQYSGISGVQYIHLDIGPGR